MMTSGIQPLQMRLDDVTAKIIAAVRPDLVLLEDFELKALATPIVAGLKNLQGLGKVMSVVSLLEAPAPLEVLANLIGISLDPYKKGEA